MKPLIVTDQFDERLYKPIDGIYGLDDAEIDMIRACQSKAFDRTIANFAHVRDPYYDCDGICPYHSSQYLVYLYYLGNTVFREFLDGDNINSEAQNVCDKVFMTELTISGADFFYGHMLPDVFLPVHALGTVVSGKSIINDYTVFTQRCNIGINNGKAPTLGRGIMMWGDTKIVGDCHIGDNVMFGANTYIKDMDVPCNSIVFGQYPDITIKEDREDEIKCVLNKYFYYE